MIALLVLGAQQLATRGRKGQVRMHSRCMPAWEPKEFVYSAAAAPRNVFVAWLNRRPIDAVICQKPPASGLLFSKSALHEMPTNMLQGLLFFTHYPYRLSTDGHMSQYFALACYLLIFNVGTLNIHES